MRVGTVVVVTALVVTGIVWILQGSGVLRGSFMTSQSFWAWMGGLAVVVGLPLLLRGFRRG